MRSKVASMSRATSGSSPSLMVTPAAVWGTYKWQTPDETPDAAKQRFTSEVMSTHSVRRDVFKRNVSVRNPWDGLPAELMNAKSGTGKRILDQCRNRSDAVERKPRLRSRQAAIDVLDVFHALVVQPVFQRFYALLAVNGNGILPGGAPA